MGEYIKNPKTGKVIKIGVLDECFYSREKLLKFKERGFKGFYNGIYDDTLDNMINDPSTLYRLDLEIPGIDELKFLVPAQGIEHKENCRFNNCRIVEAGIEGERWRDGQKRTIFRCVDCGSLFSIDHFSAMFLRTCYPEIAELFNSDEERKDFGPDISLFETLEILVDLYSFFSDLVALVGEKGEEEVQKYGYSSFLEFYNERLGRRLVSGLNYT